MKIGYKWIDRSLPRCIICESTGHVKLLEITKDDPSSETSDISYICFTCVDNIRQITPRD